MMIRAIAVSLLGVALTASVAAEVVIRKDGRHFAGTLKKKAGELVVSMPEGDYEILQDDVERIISDPAEMASAADGCMQNGTESLKQAARLEEPLERNGMLRQARDHFGDGRNIYYYLGGIPDLALGLDLDSQVKRATEGIKACRDKMVLDRAVARAPAQPDPASVDAGKEGPKVGSGDNVAGGAEKTDPPEQGLAGGPEVRPDRPISETLADLKSPDPRKVLLACDEIALKPQERAATPLVDRLFKESDPILRDALKDAAGKFPSYASFRGVDNALSRRGVSDDFKFDCVKILESCRTARATGTLAKLYMQEDNKTGKEAHKALLRLGGMSIGPLSKYLTNAPYPYRVRAIETLKTIGTPVAAGAMTVLLHYGSRSELGKLGFDEATRELAMETLRGMKRKAVPALIHSLRDPARKKKAGKLLSEISGLGYDPGDIAKWEAWWESVKDRS